MKSRIAIAALVLAMCSCTFHPEVRRPGAAGGPAGSEWTVILYFGMDNIQFGSFPTDLWGLTDNLFAGGSAVSRPDFPIIMLYDGMGEGDSRIINLGDRTIIDDRGRVIEPEAREVNYGDPETMADFIIWAAENFPARHYLLGLCHHYGWKGYNTDETSPGPIHMDILTMPEHAQAMRKVRDAGVRIDVIWFEACSINMIETLYQYGHDADFVVGNEDTIDFFELVTRPFRVLASIRKDPLMSPRRIAEVLVEKTPMATPSLLINQLTPYSFALNPKSPGEKARLERLNDLWLPTQYAFSGEGVKEAAREVDRLAGLLIERLDEEKPDIEAARKAAREYSLSPWYIDLWDFCDLLGKRTRSEEVASACAAVKQAIDRSVAAEKKISFDRRHHGMLIQFPLTADEHRSQTANEFDTNNSYSDLAFARDTLWDEFMGLYFAYESLTP